MDILYGTHSVLECIKSGARPIERLYFLQGFANRSLQDLIQLAKEKKIPFKFEPRAILDRKCNGMVHQGVVAICASQAFADIEELIINPKQLKLLVILDSIEDPRNLGAILRSCAAFEVDGVIIPKDHAAGLSSVVAKTAEGALEHLKVARVTNLTQAIEQIKQAGIWVLGVESGQKQNLEQVDLKVPLALVLGNEGKGIRRLVREHCDFLASIPAQGPILSLNVSVAAGITLYEVVRQRNLKIP
jgi:23S rRNA (guanosine2251-2'-O)-methyltransferase